MRGEWGGAEGLVGVVGIRAGPTRLCPGFHAEPVKFGCLSRSLGRRVAFRVRPLAGRPAETWRYQPSGEGLSP